MGFVVNPIAGMGGKVALKGTDKIVTEAIDRGAQPVASKRACEFLQRLKKITYDVPLEVLTCPGIMGEAEAKDAGIPVSLLNLKIGDPTTPEDTKNTVRLFVDAIVDLIVFVGGDGTARDIFDALKSSQREVPVLGVPSGVKMYSGVFAISPADAAEVVIAFSRRETQIADFEIVDADEISIRADVFAVKLYGFLKTPYLPLHVAGSKQISEESFGEKENQIAVARFIIELLPKNASLILGPGTTVKTVADLLGIEKTVLGVDICQDGKVILDVDEQTILNNIHDWTHTWLVLSPIGHQGILLGRGNQQISPAVLCSISIDHIIVGATEHKLKSIEGDVLRVDTGDQETDRKLSGYIKVVTDYREWRLMKIQ